MRVSSPLNPKPRHVRKLSVPTIPITPQRRQSTMMDFDFMAPPSSLHDARMESPARRWVRWMVRMHLRDWVLPLSLACAIWVKWTVGLGDHSGASFACPGFAVVTLTLTHYRCKNATSVWRLRSSKTLDGDHVTSSYDEVVFIRLGVLGTRLPAIDGICQLLMWLGVSLFLPLFSTLTNESS